VSFFIEERREMFGQIAPCSCPSCGGELGTPGGDFVGLPWYACIACGYQIDNLTAAKLAEGEEAKRELERLKVGLREWDDALKVHDRRAHPSFYADEVRVSIQDCLAKAANPTKTD
jgi:transposase-like protein